MFLHDKPDGIGAPLKDLAPISISERYRFIDKVLILKLQA